MGVSLAVMDAVG